MTILRFQDEDILRAMVYADPHDDNVYLYICAGGAREICITEQDLRDALAEIEALKDG